MVLEMYFLFRFWSQLNLTSFKDSVLNPNRFDSDSTFLGVGLDSDLIIVALYSFLIHKLWIFYQVPADFLLFTKEKKG